MVRMRSFTALAALAALLVAAPASAQGYRDGGPPRHRVVYKDLTLVRVNPLGLITDARLSYRYRLYEHPSVALRDNFVSVGVAPTLSAAFARIGPIVEVQPASFLTLWAQYELIGYFGSFNLLQSFPTADRAKVSYSDTSLRALSKGDGATKNYATTGTQLLVGANVQLKVGPVVFRDQVRAGRPDMKLRAGDRAFYDIYYDLLVGDGGWWAHNDADLLVQALDSRLTVGLRYSTSKAFAASEHFAPGDDRGNGPTALHRAGPLAAWTFRKPDGAGFEPTLLFLANWWLQSPYRTGQDVSQAVPYLIVALNITGDLLPSPRPPR
jgi:hypothetical protein